jgi:hypothetical protein
MNDWLSTALRAALTGSILTIATFCRASDINLTPAHLMPTIGPLVALQSTFSPYEARYAEGERSAYEKWIAGGRSATDGSSHYGALRSRYQWSLRKGLPVGPAASTDGIYSHGVEMTRSVLRGYFEPNGCAIAPYEATNIADLELLYLLEGDRSALECLKKMARHLGVQYPEHNVDLAGPNSDPRASAILLQILSVGARHDFPYTARESWGSTWRQAGVTVVERMSRQIPASGKVVSLAHRNSGQGDEAFFMNAMLAAELLRWHGFVEPQSTWLNLAQRIVDHLIDEHAQRGGACLPYTANSGKACASELAGFYVWPALVLWQETGDARYRQFALLNSSAAGSALVSGAKQFNQTYSTGAQSAEALLAAVSWRRGD